MTLGYLAVTAAAVLWAFGGTFARVLIDRGASALEITEARAWIASLALGALVLARPARPTGPARPVPPRPAWFVAFGLSIAAANYFYYAAIAALPVAVAIVIQYTAPGLVVVWLAVAGGRRPSRRVLVALALALAGVALLAELPAVVTTGELRLPARGIAAAAASAVAFAAYMLLGERLGAVGTERALFRGFLVAGALWAALQLTRGRPDTLLDGSLLPGIVLIGVVSTVVPFTLFIWGLQRVGASRAGIVSTLEPLSAAALAYVWLGQTLGALQLAGALAVVAGVAVVQAERPVTEPTPAG